MKSDLEIERKVKLKPIVDVAKDAGFDVKKIELYGKYKAKVNHRFLKKVEKKKDGNLILVTAMTPTAKGEGKTTVTIGLAQALKRIGDKSFICIREPSLGPCFGMKGGAAGGGYSQVAPMEDINLLFTGDIPSVSTANNLLSAVIDNHLFHGNKLDMDPSRISWKRSLDMNDRALRHMMVGLHSEEGYSRKESFVITAASEVMAVLCLSKNIGDLKKRLGEMIVAYTHFGKPVRVKQLGVQGAMAALLKDALNPNLVQSLEGCPAFIHGGPFANIAHGTSSLIATKIALKLSEYVVTEAGFGADLGAEKFFNIACRVGNFKPNAVVLVATLNALRRHGDAKNASKPNFNAVKKGFPNLEKQIENIQQHGIPLVVAVNKYATDSKRELDWLKAECSKLKIKAIVSDVHAKGGRGAIELASVVKDLCKKKSKLRYTYPVKAALKTKINSICKETYGARKVNYTKKAEEQIKLMEKEKLGKLLVCMAKTPKSLSDDPKLIGRPRNFDITITGVKASAGAGFIIAFCGNIMLMPGLPEKPNALNININNNGQITGLF